MYVYCVAPVADVLHRIDRPEANVHVAALVALGFVPVTGIVSRVEEPPLRVDDDPDAELEPLPFTVCRAAPEAFLGVWLASPEGDCFAEVDFARGHVGVDWVTSLENGARVLTFAVTPAVEPLMEAGSLSSWPEGGSYLRPLRDAPMVERLAAHRAHVAEAMAQEGCGPVRHGDVGDVAFAKQNGARLAANQGWWSSAYAAVPDPGGDPSGDVEAGLQQLFRNQMVERGDRIVGLAVARHAAAELRASSPGIEADGTFRPWRSWSDDEMDAAAELVDDDRPRLPDPAMMRQVAAIVLRGQGLRPTDGQLDRHVALTGQISAFLFEGEEAPAELVAAMQALVDEIAANPTAEA